MQIDIERMLEDSGVYYKLHHQGWPKVAAGFSEGFAASISFDSDRVAKTLLLMSSNALYFCLAVIPSSKRINLSHATLATGIQNLEIAGEKVVATELGCDPDRICPLNSRHLPVFIDQGLLLYPTIIIGDGTDTDIIEIAPVGLEFITDAVVLCLVD